MNKNQKFAINVTHSAVGLFIVSLFIKLVAIFSVIVSIAGIYFGITVLVSKDISVSKTKYLFSVIVSFIVLIASIRIMV
jgi:hypothetical protein